LVVAREALQAPLRATQEVFSQARARVSGAAQAVAALPGTSPRLDAALAAKTGADAATVAKSAERGCVENCRRLLQAQVDASASEVDEARAEVDANRKRLEAELETAHAALKGLQVPISATPLADRVGLPAWFLDLLTAGLGSIAANGLACGLIAFSAHDQRAPRGNGQPSTVARPADHAAQFAVENLRLGGEIDIAVLPGAYRRWCAQKGFAPLPDAEVASALAGLFERAGIAIQRDQGRLIAVGISFDGPSKSRALVALSQSS
jgi:hypothetical protein